MSKAINEKMLIVSNDSIALDVYKMVLKGTIQNLIQNPGQFVALLPCESYTLRRPISISSYDIQNESLTIIYKTFGEGTKYLSTIKEGEYIDTLGPLGKGFDLQNIKEGDEILVIAGGVGVPPMYDLNLKLQELGAKVINVFGFRNKEEAFYFDEFKSLYETHISTEDGSFGVKGNVSNIIKNLSLNPKAVFSCGPKGLLNYIQENFKHIENTQISLEERMACGIGACYACVCKSQKDGEFFKICSDGPVFNAKEVKL
ncbi:MAG: dihydroorotate dehydrogenase electron transfer subunit [Psittacicella sp.]